MRAVHPGKALVYNLSPSFNWMAHGFTDETLRSFIWDLAREGFVLQLVSLAGLHSNATATTELARAFKTDGMKAYVELVQRREKALGCEVLTHQKWSGASYIDGILGAIQSGSSSSQVVKPTRMKGRLGMSRPMSVAGRWGAEIVWRERFDQSMSPRTTMTRKNR